MVSKDKDIMNDPSMQHESLEQEMKRKGPDTSTPDFLNVRKQLTFYASYHSHPINIAIHMVCIPMILWSALLLLAHVPVTGSFPYIGFPRQVGELIPVLKGQGKVHDVVRFGKWLAFQPNLALVMNTLYVSYYIALEKFGGLTYLPIAILSQLTVTFLATSPEHHSLKIAGYVQLFSWAAQFAGHGFAEGRKPALLDSILQAFVLAPFFSHLEFLFLLFNYNPSLQAEIASGVKADKARRATLQSKIDKGMIAPRGNAIGGVMPGEVNGKKTEAKRGLEKKAQ